MPCCATAPRCITWAGWPPEPTPAGQMLVPVCDWWRAATWGAHGDDHACQRAKEVCGGGPPPCWEASVIPPAAGHHAPQKLSASRLAPDLCGLLACQTPCSFRTKTELESNSDAIPARLRESWEFRLTFTNISVKSANFPMFNQIMERLECASLPLPPHERRDASYGHHSSASRWSGRSHLAASPRRRLLVHCATSSASPSPIAFAFP